ncbi:Hypothetical protein FKW44_009485, partial [Caligus rogercresseyi]
HEFYQCQRFLVLKLAVQLSQLPSHGLFPLENVREAPQQPESNHQEGLGEDLKKVCKHFSAMIEKVIGAEGSSI